MKFKKTAKLLSTVLALAISACSLTGMAGVTSSAADGSTTTDYSAMETFKKPYINDYYTTFNMYDGMGLDLRDDRVLAIDTDWLYQVAIDKAINVDNTNPYAIYNIAENTEFTAVFSDTTDMSKINALVSRDMVNWTDAEADISGKTLKIGTPNNISFVKIVLPTDNDRSAGIKSVTYTKAENAANVHRIDFSQTKDTGAVVNNGIWHNGSTVQAAYQDNSYNAFLVYKVQPGTRFGLNVTQSDRAINYYDIAARLGLNNVLDWTMEIYGSADNVKYEHLNVSPVWSAGHTNNQNRNWDENHQKAHDARRRMDWNFIVPDGVTYIKVKFPLETALNKIILDDGTTKVYGYSGNDLFDINRVEYTELKYDYTKNTDITLSNDTKDNFGIWSYGGGFFRRSDGRFDTGYNYQYGGGNSTNVVYRVKPGTAFYSCFYIGWEGGANAFRKQYGYVVKISGSDSPNGGWTDVTNVFNNETYVAGKKYYAGIITAEQNKYEFIKISWPGKVSNVVGNDLSQLEAVAFTPNEEAYDEVAYDYTATAGQTFDNDTKANYGIYNYSDWIRYQDGGVFDTNYDSQNNNGHAGAWVSYNVKANTAFYASFKVIYSPNLTKYTAVTDFVLNIQGSNDGSNWDDVTNITIKNGDTIAATYSAYVSAEENNYKFIRVLWPARAKENNTGDDCIGLTGVAFTPYSEDAPTYKKGDVNGDNEVDLLDYVKLKKIIVGVETSTGADPDLDGNGVANGTDLTLLRKYLLGVIDTL